MACPSIGSRITKRKLDDAIEKLDSVLNQAPTSPSDTDPPSPSKRPHMARTSIYASLSKYRLFRPSSPSSSQSSPATRPISQPYALTSKPPYRPDSSSDFIDRLSTFKLSTYKDKPSQVNPVAAAKAGWINEGKERLVCGYCNSSWSLASTTGMSKEAASTLIEKQRVGLVANHKDHCPWKRAQCDDSVYRIPLRGPTSLAKELKTRADAVTPLIQGVALKHPLTTADIASLMEIMRTISSEEGSEHHGAGDIGVVVDGADLENSRSPNVPPESAVICTLFGWDASTFIPPNLPGASCSSFSVRPSTPLGSRAPTPSPAPQRSVSSRHSMTLSKASGRPLSTIVRGSERQSLPGTHRSTSSVTSLPPTPRTGSQRTSSGGTLALPETPLGSARRKPSGGSMASSLVNPRDGSTPSTAVVSCQMCLRRVGLWSFQPLNGQTVPGTSTEGAAAPGLSDNLDPASTTTGRQLDLVSEHRPYCPYVTKTTTLPTPVFSVPIPTVTRSGSIGSTNSIKKSLTSISNALTPSSGSSRGKNSDDTPVEGWRAILTVVNRAGMGMRFRRTGSSIPVASAMKDRRRPPVRNASVSFAVPQPPIAEASSSEDHTTVAVPMEVDGASMRDAEFGVLNVDEGSPRDVNIGVEKIVENVKKTREGSRDLLRYVKDLLRRSDPTPPQTASRTGGRSRNSTPPASTPPHMALTSTVTL